MYCPSCGLEDEQSNQFCRACGADLRTVRGALERPDAVTDSAISARDEIGRAFAAKIRETENARDLKKVAEDVLPQIEKFLESPAEKRLRRMRQGTTFASAGAGAAIAFILISLAVNDKGFIIPACLGIAAFLIGLGFVLNGMLFSVPKKALPDKSDAAENQRELDAARAQTGKLTQAPDANRIIASVTENTTKHLNEKQPIPRA
jgi:hypothetical protein